MGAGCCCSSKQPLYRNGFPVVSGGEVSSCFESGRLFRIVKGKKWYYYNDDLSCVMRVKLRFEAGSDVTAIDTAAITPLGADGACVICADILPLDTVGMAKVTKMAGYTSTIDADPFTESERKAHRLEANIKATDAMQGMLGIQKRRKTASEKRLVAAARSAGVMYVDLLFPPMNSSLVRPDVDRSDSGVLSVDKFCWRCPCDYLPHSWEKKITLFDKDIKPRDISQGQLGDCWFLCSVAALAEFPANIEALFTDNEWWWVRRSERRHGAWRVTLNINGWWRTYIIDSYLPSTDQLPAFACNRRRPNELWISFLEKAYAKAYGSYQAIVGGCPWHALEDLTGFPAFSFDDLWEEAQRSGKAQEKLFSSLHKWSEKGYLITVSTPGASVLQESLKKNLKVNKSLDEALALFKKTGLQSGHAYTVQSVSYFPLHQLCLLKIRNPWGQGTEWSGDWGDTSPLWEKYPFIKAVCRPKKREDGVFWMEWSDVVRFFNRGSVCYRRGDWRSTWHDYRVAGQFHLTIPDVALEVIVGGTTFSSYFTLHQRDRRGLAHGDPDGEYSGIMLSISKGALDSSSQKVIANSSDNPQEPVESYVFRCERSVSVYYTFESQSRYLIIPRRKKHSSGNNEETKAFVLGMLSSRKISDKKVKVNIIRLKNDCRVFENFTTFDTGSVNSISACYQVKHGTDLFTMRQGTCFNSGTKVDSAKYTEVM